MIERHPLLGLGPEGVKFHFEEYVAPDVPRPLPSGWYGHLHNIYLQFAAERGIPTMLCMLWLLLKAVWDFAVGLRRLPAGRSNARFILHGSIAVLLATMVSGFFEHNLGDSEVLTMFLVVLCCGYLALEKEVRMDVAAVGKL
jgi:O-antigen ligase